MQNASTYATKILEAIQLLGSAHPSHVAFATCSLTPELQSAAETAAAALRPIASRLASHKIACQLRVETAQLMAIAHNGSTPVDWASPPTHTNAGGHRSSFLANAGAPQGRWAPAQ